jgi:hypothetical protein
MTRGPIPNVATEPVAPAAGTFEQLNIFGRPVGIQVTLLRNHPCPEAPIGHSWVLADKNEDGC